LVIGVSAFDACQGWQWWLALADDPQRVIGSASLSKLSRGTFQNCSLG